jgi:DNA-binding beta-propeller fold protein YncE
VYNTLVTDPHGDLFLGDVMHSSLERRSPSGALLARVQDISLEDFTVGPGGRLFTLPILQDGMVMVFLPIRSGDTQRHIDTFWWLKGYEPRSGGLDPRGIALDHGGNLYVADTRHSYVLKYSPTGRLLAVWGHGQKSSPGNFSNPSGIAIDRWDRVYVLDRGNDRVEQFTTGGRLVRVWGRTGRAPGQFVKPSAIAVDSAGRVYVDDAGNGRIQVLKG